MPPRRARIKSSGKPMAKRGPAKAKREKKYKSFLSSAAWKRIRRAALERAGYRCENALEWAVIGPQRCGATVDLGAALTVHHKTYARFGGKELPADLQVLCSVCHNELHGRQGKRIA